MTSRTAASRILAAERARQIMELRRSGATFAEISVAAGVSAARAHQVVKAELEAARGASAADAALLIALELERLDALHAAIWPGAEGGNLRAVDGILRIMERRVKLLGLDAVAPRHREAQATDDRPVGVIVIPAALSMEEWLARYAPG